MREQANDQTRRALAAFNKSVRKKQVDVIFLLPPTLATPESNTANGTDAVGKTLTTTGRRNSLPDLKLLYQAQRTDKRSHRKWDKRHASVAARRIILQRNVMKSRAYLAESNPFKQKDRRHKPSKKALFRKWAKTAIRLNKKQNLSNQLNNETRIGILQRMVSCDATALGLKPRSDGLVDLEQAKKCAKMTLDLTPESQNQSKKGGERSKRNRKVKVDGVGFYDPATGYVTEILSQTFLDYLLREWQNGFQTRHDQRFQAVIGDFSVGLLHAQSSRDIRYALHGIWQLSCGSENWVDELIPTVYDGGQVVRAILQMVHYSHDVEVQYQALGTIWSIAYQSKEVAKALAKLRIVSLLCRVPVPGSVEQDPATPPPAEASEEAKEPKGEESEESSSPEALNANEPAEDLALTAAPELSEEEAKAAAEHTLRIEQKKHEFLLGTLCLISTFSDSSAAFDVRTESSIRFICSYLKSTDPRVSSTATSYALRTLVNISNSEHLANGIDLETCCVLFELLEKMMRAVQHKRNQNSFATSNNLLKSGGKWYSSTCHVVYCCTTILSRAVYSSPKLARDLLEYDDSNSDVRVRLQRIDFLSQFSLESGTISDLFHFSTSASQKKFAVAFRRACSLFLYGIVEGALQLPSRFSIISANPSKKEYNNVIHKQVIHEDTADDDDAKDNFYPLRLERLAESLVRVGVLGSRRNVDDLVTEEYSSRGLVRLCARFNCPQALELLVKRLINGAGEIVSSIISQGICENEQFGFPKRMFDVGVYSLLAEKMKEYQQQKQMNKAASKAVSDISEALAIMTTRIPCDEFTFKDHVEVILPLLVSFSAQKQAKDASAYREPLRNRVASNRMLSVVHNVMIVCCNLVGHPPIAKSISEDRAGLDSLADIILTNPESVPEPVLFTGTTLLWRLIATSSDVLQWAIHEKGLLHFIHSELERVCTKLNNLYEDWFACSMTTMDAIREIQELTIGSHPLNGPYFDDTISSWVIYERPSVAHRLHESEEPSSAPKEDPDPKKRPQSSQSDGSAQRKMVADGYIGPVYAIHSMKSQAFHAFLAAKANHTALELAIRKRKLKDLLAHNLANNSANATMLSLSIPFITETKALIDDFKSKVLEPVDGASEEVRGDQAGKHTLPVVYDETGKPTETSLLRIESALLHYDQASGKMIKLNNRPQSPTFDGSFAIQTIPPTLRSGGAASTGKRVVTPSYRTAPCSPVSQSSGAGKSSVFSFATTQDGNVPASTSSQRNVTADSLKRNLEKLKNPGDSDSQVHQNNLLQYRNEVKKVTPKLQILLDLLSTVLDATCQDNEPDWNMFTREICSQIYFFGYNSEMSTMVRILCCRMLSRLIIMPVKHLRCTSVYGTHPNFYLTRFVHLLAKVGRDHSPALKQCSATLFARICDTVTVNELVPLLGSSNAIGSMLRIVSDYIAQPEDKRVTVPYREAATHALFSLRCLCFDVECQETISENNGFQILLELSASCEDEEVRDLAFDVLSLIKKHPKNVSRMYLASIKGTDKHWRQHIRKVQLHTWDPDIESIVLKKNPFEDLAPLVPHEANGVPPMRSGKLPLTHLSRQGMSSKRHNDLKEEPKTDNDKNITETKIQTVARARAAKALMLLKSKKHTWASPEGNICYVRIKGQGKEHFVFDAHEPRTQLNLPRYELMRFPKFPNTRILPEVPVFKFSDGREAHFFLKGEPPLQIFNVNFDPISFTSEDSNKVGQVHKHVLEVKDGSQSSLERVTIARHGAIQSKPAKPSFLDLGFIVQSPPGPRPEQYPAGMMSTHRFLGQKGPMCGRVLDEPVYLFRWFEEASWEDGGNEDTKVEAEVALKDRYHSDESECEEEEGDELGPLVAVGESNETTEKVRNRRSIIQSKWNVGQSVFSKRASSSDSNTCWNTNEVMCNCFEWDWKICERKETFSRMLRKHKDDIEHVKQVLREHYGIICSLFRYFCASDDHNIFSMGANEFRIFTSVSEIVDPSSTLCQQGHLDTIFVSGCFNAGHFGPRVASRFNEECKAFQLDKNDRVLLRWEFTECLVRIAEAKYFKVAKASDLGEAMALLWQNCLERYVRESTLDYDAFRTSRLYLQPVDAIFQRRVERVRTVFNLYTGDCSGRMTMQEALTWGSQPNSRMSLQGWSMLIEDLGLISANFGRIAAHLVFSMSFLNVVNPIRNWRQTTSLCFVGFLEALGRLADVVLVPTSEQLSLLGAANIMEFYYIAEATGLINEDIFALEEWAKDAIYLLCRNNKVIASKPPFHLWQKLDTFLDLVESVEEIREHRATIHQSWEKDTSDLHATMSKRARTARSGLLEASSRSIADRPSEAAVEPELGEEELAIPEDSEVAPVEVEGAAGEDTMANQKEDEVSQGSLVPGKERFKTGKKPKKKKKKKSQQNDAETTSFEETVADALHDAWRETRRRVPETVEQDTELDTPEKADPSKNPSDESEKDTKTLPGGNSEKGDDLEYEPRLKPIGGKLIDIANLSFCDLPLVFRLENLLAAYNACEEIRKAILSLGKQKRSQRKVLTLLTSDEFLESSCAKQHDAWVTRNKAHADKEQLVPYEKLREDQKKNVRAITKTAISVYCEHVYGATVFDY